MHNSIENPNKPLRNNISKESMTSSHVANKSYSLIASNEKGKEMYEVSRARKTTEAQVKAMQA